MSSLVTVKLLQVTLLSEEQLVHLWSLNVICGSQNQSPKFPTTFFFRYVCIQYKELRHSCNLPLYLCFLFTATSKSTICCEALNDENGRFSKRITSWRFSFFACALTSTPERRTFRLKNRIVLSCLSDTEGKDCLDIGLLFCPVFNDLPVRLTSVVVQHCTTPTSE